jgi:hydrogenase/urease accessory protein HupE
LLWLALALLHAPVAAHEVRPAYLEIRERMGGAVEIRWRQPVIGEYTILIRPVLSSGWLDGEPERRYATQDSLITSWTIPAPRAPLPGQTLRIDGLDRTITDTLVRIEYAGGRVVTRLLKPAHPAMQIPDAAPAALALPHYLRLGIGHIWSGVDHLLYVLGLILLISGLRTLVFTLTAFTVAHSVTLAGAALGLIHLRPAPVEAVIALSIVYVAAEILRVRRGESPMPNRAPWLMAFAFGLLHGFGFAGALREIGLPDDAIAGALLLFNAGIELGQLLFLALVLAVLKHLRDDLPALQHQVFKLAPYGIGSLASFWLLQRLAAL